MERDWAWSYKIAQAWGWPKRAKLLLLAFGPRPLQWQQVGPSLRLGSELPLALGHAILG